GEPRSASNRGVPCSRIFWDVLEMVILRKTQRRGLWSPPSHAGKSIGAVSHYCQVVGNRFGFHTEFIDDARFVADDFSPAVQLNDSRTDDALREIFIWSADDHLADSLISGCYVCGRRERIIGFVVDHRPH